MTDKAIPHFTSKIQRNEQCPCGSGKKYKKCHGGVDGGAKLQPQPGKIDARLRKLTPPRKCLAPSSLASECSKGTIDAHTVSRSGSLSEITRNGHVYSYKFSLQELVKSNGKLLPTLTGWRDASTFPGFCSFHDKSLFSPLEDKAFLGSKEQCFLLSYRAVIREYYAKQASALQSELRFALGAKNKRARQFVNDFNKGVDLGMRDLITHKSKYDIVLESGNWGSVKAVLIEFDGIFPIQCAGAFFPDRDIDGKKLQTIGFGKQTPDLISLTSFAAGGISYVCFCWLIDSHASCSAYVSAVERAPLDDLPAVVAALLLQSSENCHFSPDWYDGMSPAGQQWCAEQMRRGITFEDFLPPRHASGSSYINGVTVKAITTVA